MAVNLNSIIIKDNTISISKNAKTSRAQVIDGFVKGPSQAVNQKPSGPKPTPKNISQDIKKPLAGQLHSRTEKTHTLMRGALKKPTVGFTSKIQRVVPGSNPQREARAKSTAKHSRVIRFGNPVASAGPSNQRQVIEAEVRPKNNNETKASNQSPASTAVAMPSMIASASHQKLERLLDEALHRADSHKQALRYQAARHFWQKPGFLGRRAGLKIAVTTLLLLILLGVISWVKLPQFSIKVASAQAHMDASVPSYTPAGYSFAAPALADNNSVVIQYKSSTEDSHNYKITQKESNMTSTNLAQSVIPAGAQVQTSQVGGNTVYIYGVNNDAAWVNNGIFYQINDHAKLSSDEILKIVQGLN